MKNFKSVYDETYEGYDIYKYKIEASNESGCTAPEFINRYFKTMKAAINAFDSIYSRRGFDIVIYKLDAARCYEPIVARIVKSTYR